MYYFSEECRELLGILVPRKRFYRCRDGFARWGIGQKFSDRSRYRRRIALDNTARVARRDELADAADIACDNWCPASQRLDPCVGQTLAF